MILVQDTTVIAITQIISVSIYTLCLPPKKYLKESEIKPCGITVCAIMSPTVFILIQGTAPAYLMGISLLSLIVIYKDTAVVLAVVVNTAITILSWSIASLFAVLEFLSMLHAVLPVRFLIYKIKLKHIKQFASMFIFNSISYFSLVMIITHQLHSIGNHTPTNTLGYISELLAFYTVIKFGNLLFGSLKSPVYALLPLRFVVILTILVLCLVPFIALSAIESNLFTPVAVAIVVIPNIVAIGFLLFSKTVPSLLLYTTILTNLAVIVLYSI